MIFVNDDEAKKVISEYLLKDGIKISGIELVNDPNVTMVINLVTYKVKIGKQFLKSFIRSIDDVKFLIEHEVHHRYICNQWNKMRFLNEIKFRDPQNRKPEDIEIDWEALNIAEDSFINSYIRNSGTITSDFPEYYYCGGNPRKKPVGINRWLCFKGKFPKKEVDKNALLNTIRTNSEFFIKLDLMADLYWYIINEKKKETKRRRKLCLLTFDDPTGTGKIIRYGTEDEAIIFKIQEDAEKAIIAVMGQSGAKRIFHKYIPDLERDINLSKLFNVRTKDMTNLERREGHCKVLVDYLEGIVQKARIIQAETFNDVTMPSSLTRHDMLMSVGFDIDPIYWQHRMPSEMGEDNKDNRWDVYMDVSSSMDHYIPLSRFIMHKLGPIRGKGFMFSTVVLPYDGGCWIATTQGTDMKAAIEAAANKGVPRIIFVGDAEDGGIGGLSGFGWDKLSKKASIFMKKAESIFVLVANNSKYEKWAKEVFKYVYNLDLDVMQK